MECTILRHGCKINLFLRIGRRLPDGYHELESLFLPLPMPCDRLEVTAARGTGPSGVATSFFAAESPCSPLEGIDPLDNSLTKAHAWYAGLTGYSPGLDIRVFKAIPPGGGLGGGSANAAALLLYLQERASRAGFSPVSREELIVSSKILGADVPFFLLGKAAYATGIGERLEAAENPVSGKHLLLVCPDLSVSTAGAYADLDKHRELCEKSVLGEGKSPSRKQGLTSGRHQATNVRPDAWAAIGNDFEEVVFRRYPELARLKERLLGMGAELARMSGTGACMFALFKSGRSAEASARALACGGAKVYCMRV